MGRAQRGLGKSPGKPPREARRPPGQRSQTTPKQPSDHRPDKPDNHQTATRPHTTLPHPDDRDPPEKQDNHQTNHSQPPREARRPPGSHQVLSQRGSATSRQTPEHPTPPPQTSKPTARHHLGDPREARQQPPRDHPDKQGPGKDRQKGPCWKGQVCGGLENQLSDNSLSRGATLWQLSEVSPDQTTSRQPPGNHQISQAARSKATPRQPPDNPPKKDPTDNHQATTRQA